MLGGNRVKHVTPDSGVASGLSSSGSLSEADKKLRGEGTGQIPHAPAPETVKKKQGTFVVC